MSQKCICYITPSPCTTSCVISMLSSSYDMSWSLNQVSSLLLLVAAMFYMR
eukprot:m.176830 g.176830  ORF g.176830 m.176830 type:complete len:51 (+) comp15448_c0_seq21:2272-2424(+)